jgi:DNA-binding CsgD family transcriptional regulator
MPRSSRALDERGSTTASADVSERAEASTGTTPGEHEILALIAEGLSNREVAEQFVVSARTIAHHVESIYRKLEVHNRIEARNAAVVGGLCQPGSTLGARRGFSTGPCPIPCPPGLSGYDPPTLSHEKTPPERGFL